MEFKFKKVRKQLDELGYVQVFNYECLPLVEKLAADLIQTTESLRKYKKIAKDASEERDQLQIGAEPFKCDNAKLVKECNDLHLTFLQIREQNEKVQRDLKRRLVALESDKLDCNLQCDKLKNRVRELQLELSKKSGRYCVSCDKNKQAGSKTNIKSSYAYSNSQSKCCSSKCNTEINAALTMSDQRICNLTREIKKLKDEHLQLAETNETYKNQLNNRDREIERLNQMLEGGRPIQALSQDCCYKDVEGKLSRMQNEICCLRKDKGELESQLKESVGKQHEAMRRALNLADRNKKLEKELRDIDQMALAVEADCNSTVKANADRVNRMQEQMHDAILQMQTLERDVNELKRDKQKLIADIDALKLEKRHLQSVLETALDEKKRLNDQINQFTIIEHDLNLEIDRLVQSSAVQKRKIAELECKLLADKFDSVTDRSDFQNQKSQTSPRDKSPSKHSKSKKGVGFSKKKNRDRSGSSKKTSNGAGDFSKKSKGKLRNKSKNNRATSPLHHSVSANEEDLLIITPMPPKSKDAMKKQKNSKKKSSVEPKSISQGDDSPSTPNKSGRKTPHNSPNSPPSSTRPSLNEVYDNNRVVEQSNGYYPCCNCCKCMQRPSGLDKRRSERERFDSAKEKVDQTKSLTSKDNHAELLQKLNEKEQSLTSLQHENKMLSQEKHNLMTRLEAEKNSQDNNTDVKSELRRTERERDLLKSDVIRLEEEKNAMKQRLKSLSDSQALEQTKMKEILLEAESQVRQLERERRDLMHGQGSRRATISVLEEQCEDMTIQLRACQCELNQQRSMYGQLKTLHEQTDRALGDSQAQLVQVEAELDRIKNRSQHLEKEKDTHEQEVSSLKYDIKTMRGSLAKIDQEKDGLLMSVDDKTEKVSMLEEQLRCKCCELEKLENSMTELKAKLSLTMESTASKELLLKNASVESTALRMELENANRAKESSLQENRRLQEDLTASTIDCRCARNELEICKNQIEDLKRQLQTYVAEVKRFEDLMTKKEVERSELLDQFKSLSQEAVLLENNNHSLENEATQSKVQLSVTLDHVSDLENKLTCQCNLISNYEDQISQLKAKITNLETKLTHTMQQQERAEADLASIRDLCMKLDKQKDNLMRELTEKDSERDQMGREALKMKHESEIARASLARDRTSLHNLEKLLAEARQDSVQLQLHNQELEMEVKTLRQKIDDVEGRLCSRTSTFTYSANLHGSTEANVCTCCVNCPDRCPTKNNTGDVIETTTKLTNQDGECKCCGKFTQRGQMKSKENESDLKFYKERPSESPQISGRRLTPQNLEHSRLSTPISQTRDTTTPSTTPRNKNEYENLQRDAKRSQSLCCKTQNKSTTRTATPRNESEYDQLEKDAKRSQSLCSKISDREGKMLYDAAKNTRMSTDGKNCETNLHDKRFNSVVNDRATLGSIVPPPFSTVTKNLDYANCDCKSKLGKVQNTKQNNALQENIPLSVSHQKVPNIPSNISNPGNVNVTCTFTTSYPTQTNYTDHYSHSNITPTNVNRP